VNWHSFSVGGEEYVKFVQPGANAAILNRVVGGNASQILGRIDANGRVFLVNPQGVYFGAGAKVDAAAFAASTLDIADDDFMHGRYVFTKGTGSADGTVENHGEIVADQFVALLGDRVSNEGLVQARLGTVALGAGEQVTLTLDDAGLVSFAVDEATAAALAGVENTGEIVANGGRVLMTAKVAEGLVATAVNNAGVVRARGIEVADGGIYLRGSGGSVVNSGTLDASGAQGGTIRVTSTQDVEITSGATVTAAGAERGGDVRLVAQQNLRVETDALVDTRSETAGQGGTIELSAHEGVLKVDGDIRTGDGGELIIDPARVRIDAGAGGIGSDGGVTTIRESFIETQLNYGGFTLVASDEIFSSATQASPITINSTATNSLLLRIGTGGLFGSSFSADADGSINLQHVNFDIAGSFEARAGTSHGNVFLGQVSARDVLRIQAGSQVGNITTGPLTVAGVAGDVRLELYAEGFSGSADQGVVTVNGNVLAQAQGTSLGRARIEIDARQIRLQGGLGAIALGAGGSADVDLRAERGVSVQGNVTLGALDNGDADLYVSNYGGGSGDIVFQGPLALTGGNLANVVFGNDAGAVRIGPLSVRQVGTAASPAGAFVEIEAATDVRFGGPVEVAGQLGLAYLLASAQGGGEAQGEVVVKSGSASAFAGFEAANIALRNRVTVESAEGGFLSLTAHGGSIVANGPALLTAGVVGFELDDASFVDVRTQAETLYFQLDDTPTGISLDNSAHAGETLVYLSDGSDGVDDPGYQSSASAGPVKALFRGDTLVLGSFAARNAMIEVTEGSLGFSGPVLIGDLNLPPSEGDALSLQALALARRPDGSRPGLPRFNGVPTSGANAVFEARDGLYFEQGLVFNDPDTPYVAFITDGPLELGPGVASIDPLARDFLAQFTAYSPGKSIFIEATLPAVHSQGGPTFTRAEHFAKLPGTTLIIGNSRVDDFAAAGDIFVGRNGTVDIGDQNVLFATGGRVAGVGNIRSTGFIGELSTVALTEQVNERFPLPFVGDIRPEPMSAPGAGEAGETAEDDEGEDEGYVAVDETGEGESSELVAQRANDGQMCR